MTDSFKEIHFKRFLNSTIEFLDNQELTEEEFKEKLKQIVKPILPNASIYLMSVITNYAKSIKNCNDYEKILFRELEKYLTEGKDNDR